MKLKLLILSGEKIAEYSFSDLDSNTIICRCKEAGKQWADQRVGFLISDDQSNSYAAIAVKGDDNLIECMEYRDIDTSEPEFSIDVSILESLSGMTSGSECSLAVFENMLDHIISAPRRARRWEVYPEISKRLATTH